MFVVEIDFLTGRYYASDYTDRERPEWPPHPGRLYSALVATAFETGITEAKRQALLWLEAQRPPEIWASRCAERSWHIAYVPVNDPLPGALLPATRSKQPRHFPCVTPTVPVVYFSWPDAVPNGEIAAELKQLVADVARLGSTKSVVRANVLPGLPELDGQLYEHYVPSSTGDRGIRVPHPGRLQELETLFQLGRRPQPGAIVSYRRVSKRRQTSQHSNNLVWLATLQASKELTLDVEATARVCSTALAMLLDGIGAVPAALRDDDGRPRCLFVPLPFVGHDKADGRLLGLALLAPDGLERAERYALLRGLRHVLRLPLPGLGTWQLQPLPLGDDNLQLRNLQPHSWSRRATAWATVTPFILPRFPKRRRDRPEDQVADVMEAYLGLPRPVTVKVSRFAFWTGIPAATDFATLGSDRGRPVVHAVVQFAEPVRGPIIAGAGRHRGLGLFRPLPEGGAGYERPALR